MVIDLAASRLEDVDIFPADGLLDLDSSLTNGELREENRTGRDPEVVTNCFVQLRMGAATENNNVADHDVEERIGSNNDFKYGELRGSSSSGGVVGFGSPLLIF